MKVGEYCFLPLIYTVLQAGSDSELVFLIAGLSRRQNQYVTCVLILAIRKDSYTSDLLIRIGSGEVYKLMFLLGNCRRDMMSLSLLVGRTVAIFTAYIYKHMFESSMSERSTLPESYLNKTYMYDRIQAVRESIVLRVLMYVCMYSMFGWIPFCNKL